MSRQYDYDAIIIGAGISGIVCGCYLAKAGMKTLILEKNTKPGGYCTSFNRGDFHFDACVHSLGSLREGGNIRIILKELGLEERLRIKRYDPSDIIIAPDSFLE
jgi:phytoene desaturase